MRKKYIPLAMALMLSASLVSGCGSNSTTTAEATTEADANTIYGQIKSIKDDTITLEVGTMKEKPDDTKSSTSEKTKDDEESTSETSKDDGTSTSEASKDTDSSEKTRKAGKQGDFSMLDLTGETEEITVSDDTSITKQSMGGFRGGQMPGNGQAPNGDSDGQAANGDSDKQPPNGDSDSQPPSGGQAPNGDSDSQPPSGGQAPSGDSDSQPPAKPGDNGNGSSDESSTGDAGSKPTDAATTEDISLSDLGEGDTISVTTDADGNVTEITLIMDADMQGGGAPGGQGEQATGVDSYTSVKEFTEDASTEDETYKSTGKDENAILVDKSATVTLDDATISRKSSDSTGGDNSSFYGVGAAVLTTDGVTTLNNADITTDAAGGAGVFAYGDGEVYVNDSSIKTKKGTSGGIHVAGGGTLYASDCDVETEGESSAAIRSDRGGGKMEIEGGSYTSNGTGSPAIYSTADITVSDATLTANKSEAICIEGSNSIKLTDCSLTGNMPDDDQNDSTWNVILYQSMSGDSEEGNATFTMEGGSLTAKNGGMFYTTNTESTFNLENVDIKYADDSDYFLKCTGNSNKRGWGTSGSNGAECSFNATDQTMEGDIIWDSISTLEFDMSGESTLTGAIKDDESNAGNGGDGYCNLTISEDSKWVVTGDSTLSSLTNHGTITDSDGKTVTIKGSDGTTYVDGNSNYSITVGSYSD